MLWLDSELVLAAAATDEVINCQKILWNFGLGRRLAAFRYIHYTLEPSEIVLLHLGGPINLAILHGQHL